MFLEQLEGLVKDVPAPQRAAQAATAALSQRDQAQSHVDFLRWSIAVSDLLDSAIIPWVQGRSTFDPLDLAMEQIQLVDMRLGITLPLLSAQLQILKQTLERRLDDNKICVAIHRFPSPTAEFPWCILARFPDSTVITDITGRLRKDETNAQHVFGIPRTCELQWQLEQLFGLQQEGTRFCWFDRVPINRTDFSLVQYIWAGRLPGETYRWRWSL